MHMQYLLIEPLIILVLLFIAIALVAILATWIVKKYGQTSDEVGSFLGTMETIYKKSEGVIDYLGESVSDSVPEQKREENSKKEKQQA